MRKLTYFMHVSLDGFVAGPNGEMDWITVDDEIFDFVGDRTNVGDMAMYGRKTYEMMESYWPTAGDQPNASKHDIDHARWYNKVTKVVLSRTLKSNSEKKLMVISDDIASQVTKLKQQPGSEILIFGSPGAGHSLTALGLIDSFWLFINPVLIGKGTPLFKNVSEITKLKLVKSHAFGSGVVCLNYEGI